MSAISRVGIILALAALALAAGCGQQDLYDPPGSPFAVVGRLHLPSTAEAVVMQGDWAYLAAGEAGLVTVDISDRRAPRLVGMLNTAKQAGDVELVRTFFHHELHDIAYVSDETEGVLFVDVTNPAVPTWSGGKTETYFATNIFAMEPADLEEPYVLFIPDGWHGLVWATAQPDEAPGTVTYSGDRPTLGEAYGIVVRDGWGYVADNHMGLVVMDLHVLNETAIHVSSWTDTPGAARDVVLAGDYAFVADGLAGLTVLKVNGGEAPTFVLNYDLSGYSEDLAYRDGLLAIASDAGGVHFLDMTNPEQPYYLGSNATPFALGVCFGDDGTCLVADQEDGLLVLAGRGPFRDETDPAAITSLTCTPQSAFSVTLDWVATGDDRVWGQAAGVEIRYATAPITDEASWAAATPVANPPSPAAPGVPMSFDVSGLDELTQYHFAVRMRDDADRLSGLSNAASATTLAGISLRQPLVTPEVAAIDATFTYEVTCYFRNVLTTHDVLIDGTLHAMTNVAPLGVGDSGVYRYQTQLEPGEHSFQFRFTAPDVPAAETAVLSGPTAGAYFQMGSPADEPGRAADEVAHFVVLSRPLEGAATEVTQAEWDAVMPAGTNPSAFAGADRPVDSVTWREACAYCNARSLAEGLTPCYTIVGDVVTWNRDTFGWRLPTEAEWEYLCRAGSTTAFAGGAITALFCNPDPVLLDAGWYCANAGAGSHDVGGKAPNAGGLRDMHGNLREWCWDWYGDLGSAVALDPAGAESGTQRVCRGGSWYYASQDCRSAARGKFYPDSRDNTVGLRVVRNLVID
jgi:formylglycine-generating enzyme required for sulfatase activity